MERAYERDVGGEQAVAAKLYRATLQPIYEALQLQVPSPGLDPAHSNVAKWRSELNTWQQLVLDRWGQGARSASSRGLHWVS